MTRTAAAVMLAVLLASGAAQAAKGELRLVADAGGATSYSGGPEGGLELQAGGLVAGVGQRWCGGRHCFALEPSVMPGRFAVTSESDASSASGSSQASLLLVPRLRLGWEYVGDEMVIGVHAREGPRIVLAQEGDSGGDAGGVEAGVSLALGVRF